MTALRLVLSGQSFSGIYDTPQVDEYVFFSLSLLLLLLLSLFTFFLFFSLTQSPSDSSSLRVGRHELDYTEGRWVRMKNNTFLSAATKASLVISSRPCDL